MSYHFTATLDCSFDDAIEKVNAALKEKALACSPPSTCKTP